MSTKPQLPQHTMPPNPSDPTERPTNMPCGARAEQGSNATAVKTWLDDATLLAAWRAGDDAARDALVRRYDLVARRRLRYRARRDEDVDELVQQVLIRFTHALARYEGRGKIRSFYVAVEGHTVFDYYRRCYRDPESFDPDLLTEEDLDGLSASRRLCLNRHLTRLAYALVTVLTLNEKLVVEQLFIDRLPVPVVAESLGVAESTVRGLLMRARQKLKDHFGDDYMQISRGNDVDFDELAQQLAELGHAVGLLS